RLQPKAILMFLKSLFQTNIRKREKMILETVSNAKHKHHEVYEKWVEIQQKRPVSRQNALNQIVAASRFKLNFKNPKADILIAAGKKDNLAHYQCSIEIANYWQAPIILHEEAGHELFLDEPEWLIQNIKDWLYEFRE